MSLVSRVGLVLLVSAMAVAGCGKNDAVLVPVTRSLPPEIREVFPAARSVGVPYDIREIWIDFVDPIDSTTATRDNVYLKIDTRRLEIAVDWNLAERRVRIVPAEPFRLAETYTVEISPGFHSATGASLGASVSWQFTITGLRRLETPVPAPGPLRQSPFVPLAWDRTEASAGTVEYDVYVDTDSSAVAERRVAPVRVTRAEWVRLNRRWNFDSRYFWAVTAYNRTSVERLDGDVWSFTTVASDAPIDSLSVPAQGWGFYNRRTRQTVCLGSTMTSGPIYDCVLTWNLASLRPSRRIAGVRVKMNTVSQSTPPTSWICSGLRPAVYSPCDFDITGIMTCDQLLSFSQNTGTAFEFRYASDALSSHVAAAHAGMAVYGYAVGSDATITHGSPPTMVIHYYK